MISCYELGHQPAGLRFPLAFLRRAGFDPIVWDLAAGQTVDPDAFARARFVGISVPMHTALRLGVQIARMIRSINPGCHICFYGLYAWLNESYLLGDLANSVLGGEFEELLVRLVETIQICRIVKLPNGRMLLTFKT